MEGFATGRPALEIWTRKELSALYHFLHNDNGPFDWAMGFLDRETLKPRFTRSKKVAASRGMSWAIASLSSDKLETKRIAFAPYASNADGMSRWGALDFDAHDGDESRAREFAFAATECLRSMNFTVILESSGSGGWHVWALAPEFRCVNQWIRLLKLVARDIGAEIKSGICEIFPSDSIRSGLGKALRAPGTRNPKTQSLSLIHWQNVESLLTGLSGKVSSVETSRIGELARLPSVSSSIEKKTSLFSFSSLKEGLRPLGIPVAFSIQKRATRHEQLSALVGATFWLCSKVYGQKLAELQLAEATASTNASASEHREDFLSLWAGMESAWFASMPSDARAKFDLLTTDAERDAFRIIENFARLSGDTEADDFPIGRDNLAARLAMTGKGAGQLRMRFVKLGILQQTAQYRPNVAAARYRWNLQIPDAY